MNKLQTIRIMLVDDHALFRKGVKALLAARPDFQVVAEAGNGAEAVERASQIKPDIILMDIDMPVMNGLEATRAIKVNLPAVQIVILTVSDYDRYLFEAIKSGASGYLLKNLEPYELFEMLDKVKRGEAAINGILAARILTEFSRKSQPVVEGGVDRLTPREIDVLNRLVRGEDNKEIAESLSIAPNTVKTHINNIMEKLHLRNRVETAVYAIKQGLVDYKRTDEQD